MELWNDWKEFAGDVLGVASLFVMLFVGLLALELADPYYTEDAQDDHPCPLIQGCR
jgi:hypothetical protein